MKKIMFTLDVEPDLHTSSNKGIAQGLIDFEKICDKHKVKPTLFIVASLIKDNTKTFLRLKKKGWTLGLHGLSHKRFDDSSYEEKEAEIKESIALFQKHLKITLKGFRAPQHSIDQDTLDLLEKYHFKYDSSYTPLNLLQLFFFPDKAGSWLRNFFSSTSVYKIRRNLLEIPTSAFVLPFVSLTVRVLPLFLLKPFIYLIKIIYEKPVFYAHSWDFIEQPESRVDRRFSHKELLKKLDIIMSWES